MLTSSTSIRCALNDSECISTPVFERSQFCGDVAYGKSCNDSCRLSWQRANLLNWMNNTCGNTTNWRGLPSNWTTLLDVQESELMPWAPVIAWNRSDSRLDNPTAQASIQPSCPSGLAKLGVFAAVNIVSYFLQSCIWLTEQVMAILVPILGRRTVVQRLTFGIFGHVHSRGWLLTGPLSIVLQVSSNILNALMIQGTDGFHQVDIRRLVLLWFTRPRLAWLIVVLVPWQAREAMYFSVAASTLLAEVALQLVSTYYMGNATNYARLQKFFTVGRLDNTPHGSDTMTMYAGALLWLVVLFFALVACGSAIFGVDQRIANLGRAIRGRARKAGGHAKRCATQAGSVTGRKSKFRERMMFLDWVPRDLETLESSLNECAEKWTRLRTYVDDDATAYEKAAKSYESAREEGRNGAQTRISRTNSWWY